ncbi:L-Ala-D/L-Glu epimerase, partial [Pantoea agglomerans]|nr:L-Ala-D/L-Glu epimerase [Pantoea agglomerans]
TEVKVVVVEIEEDGVKGVGEATPYARYGESEASVLAQIAAHQQQSSLWQLSRVTAPEDVVTAQTVSIDTPEAMASSAL